MNNPGRVFHWLKWWGGLIVLGTFLVWGGRHAYCHFYGHMAESGLRQPADASEPERVVAVVSPLHRSAALLLTLPATVEAFEKATLYAKVSGYLQSIKVDKGDRVAKGEVLAIIEVPELEMEFESAQAAVQEAQASYERAKADAALKELTFKRLASARDSQPGAVSLQELDVARAAFEVAQRDISLTKAKLDVARSQAARLEVLTEYAKVKSPYDGIVTERFVDPGNLIQSAETSKNQSAAIVTVVDMDKVRVYVDVPEPSVSKVSRGRPVVVRLDALPGEVFTATITRFSTALDPQTRTMKAEIDLPNRGLKIRPGMFGSATLKLGEEADALFLPSASVRVDSSGKKYVFAVADGRVRKIPVETGLDDGKLVEVRGLRGNESVVLSSAERLEEGLAVKAVKAAS